jgi:hypothetical protein
VSERTEGCLILSVGAALFLALAPWVVALTVRYFMWVMSQASGLAL